MNVAPHPPGLRPGGAADIENGQEHPLDTLPKSKSQAGQFDYGGLPDAIASEANAAAERVRKKLRGAVIDVGAELASVEDRLPHGQFGKWLDAEFGFTERTAQNYMAAAALAAKYETVSVLQPKTIYLLAAPSTPEPVREEIIRRLDASEIVPNRAVKEMVDEAKWQLRSAAANRKRSTVRSPAISRTSQPASKEAQLRALREQQATGANRFRVADELVQVLRVLQGDRSRIAQFPLAKRVALARGCLTALDVSLDDLQPISGAV